MYLDFYRLKKAPFHITPDPEFLYLSPSHKAALGSMIYGIEARQGFVAITGEVGLGKTTILRSYLERIDQHKLKAIYIFNANISFRSLLKIIFQEFGVEFEAEDLFEMVNRLHQVLIEEYQQGRNVALIIDEAQNMPLETLENLRMLSNLETATEKLVQIVLIGQPEFDHKLNLNELRQLKQRLVIRSTLEPLTDEESMTYILYRLAKVTLDDTLIFTKGALKLILAKAKGTPRTLNILCTNALITGFGYRQKPITAETVKEVLADVAGKKKAPRFKRGLVWVAATTLCAGVFWLSPYRQVMLAKFGQAGALPHTIEKLQGTNNNTIAYPTNPHKDPGQKPQERLEATETEPPTEGSFTPQKGQSSAGTAAPEKHVKSKEPQLDTSSNFRKNNYISEKERQHGNVYKEPQMVSDERSDSLSIRILNKGDNITKIALEFYGLANEEILQFVRKYNPQIKDLNKVEAGEKVFLPVLQSVAQ